MGKSNGVKRKHEAPAEVLETEVRTCTVPLTEAERLERADAMVKCELQIEALKLERAALGRVIRKNEERRNQLGHTLETGTEERELVCTWMPDYSKNVLRLTRPDTREVIDTRPMTAEDRMVPMFPDAGDPPPRSPRPRGRPRKSLATASSGDSAS